MKETVIEIPKETVDYLQRLAYEQTARQGVIDYIITAHKADPDDSVLSSAVFTSYMHDLTEVTGEYEAAKAAIPVKFFQDLNVVEWNLDFTTRKATVKYA